MIPKFVAIKIAGDDCVFIKPWAVKLNGHAGLCDISAGDLGCCFSPDGKKQKSMFSRRGDNNRQNILKCRIIKGSYFGSVAVESKYTQTFRKAIADPNMAVTSNCFVKMV